MEGVPERITLGRVDMLNSTGFVFHENSLCSHPCGAEPGRAKWKTEAYPQRGPLNICRSLIDERHRFDTCPHRDLLSGSITSPCPLPRSQLHPDGPKFTGAPDSVARIVAV